MQMSIKLQESQQTVEASSGHVASSGRRRPGVAIAICFFAIAELSVNDRL
jgi:hypothetical protein